MVSSKRLQQQLATLKKITAPGRGINRLAFTDADWQGRSYLMGLMREAGMELREDAFGNVIGHVQG
ncbi:MAG: Zn-dependent hydrolase, partial [Mitsuokella jalaludinii]|nr:Zn-dependent hydrolase [Mitsuokella jalaludinii]